jgi:hypothetical protein
MSFRRLAIRIVAATAIAMVAQLSIAGPDVGTYQTQYCSKDRIAAELKAITINADKITAYVKKLGVDICQPGYYNTLQNGLLGKWGYVPPLRCGDVAQAYIRAIQAVVQPVCLQLFAIVAKPDHEWVGVATPNGSLVIPDTPANQFLTCPASLAMQIDGKICANREPQFLSTKALPASNCQGCSGFQCGIYAWQWTYYQTQGQNLSKLVGLAFPVPAQVEDIVTSDQCAQVGGNWTQPTGAGVPICYCGALPGDGIPANSQIIMDSRFKCSGNTPVYSTNLPRDDNLSQADCQSSCMGGTWSVDAAPSIGGACLCGETVLANLSYRCRNNQIQPAPARCPRG